MRAAVIGAGAVGLAVGSTLLAAGARTSFVARPDVAAALRYRGVRRTGIFGEQRSGAGDFEVVESVETLTANRDGEALDFLLVCTKAFDSQPVASDMARAWDGVELPRVVLFHNGWGSAEHFAERLPPERIYSARLITGFRRRDATTSEITVHADAIRLGSLFGASLAPLSALAERLESGGLPCRVSEDIGRDLWAKLIYNCALNPLGALCGVSYGALAEDAKRRALIEAVVGEIFAVMDASGQRTDWDGPGPYLHDFYESILPPTAAHESSMLQDLRAGKQTEIDALCGAVSELGVRHGVATPVNSALLLLIRAAEGHRT